MHSCIQISVIKKPSKVHWQRKQNPTTNHRHHQLKDLGSCLAERDYADSVFEKVDEKQILLTQFILGFDLLISCYTTQPFGTASA